MMRLKKTRKISQINLAGIPVSKNTYREHHWENFKNNKH